LYRASSTNGGSMNWKLGFFRIWLVAAICWAAFVGWLVYNETLRPHRLAEVQQACVDAYRADPALGNVFDCFNKGVSFDNVVPLGILLPKYLALAAGPMVGAFLLWFVGAWIVAGFNRRPT